MKASTARTHQARGPVATRKCAARQILTRAKKEKKKSEDTSNHEEVYIGQGKYVTDDPKKYPSKSQWTGGWAGGEEGLQKFLEEAAQEGYDDSKDPYPTGPSTKLLEGDDVIYTGQGNYVRDKAERYPTKDGFSGGFAGGERGVEKYVSDGELEFDKDNKQPFSPLVAGLGMSATAIIITSAWLAIAGNVK